MSKTPAPRRASRAACPEPELGFTNAGIRWSGTRFRRGGGPLRTKGEKRTERKRRANSYRLTATRQGSTVDCDGRTHTRPRAGTGLTTEDSVDRRAQLRELEGFLDDLAGRLAREIGSLVGDQVARREDKAAEDFGGVFLDAVVQFDTRQAGHPKIRH